MLLSRKRFLVISFICFDLCFRLVIVSKFKFLFFYLQKLKQNLFVKKLKLNEGILFLAIEKEYCAFIHIISRILLRSMIIYLFTTNFLKIKKQCLNDILFVVFLFFGLHPDIEKIQKSKKKIKLKGN